MSTGFEKIGSDYRLQNHWIRRLIAFVIDSIIVRIGTFVVSIPFTIAAAATGLPWFFFNPLIGPFFIGFLSVLYFALLEYLYGWTFGKRIMSLETMRTDGQKPSLDAAFIRNISKIYWILVLLDVIIGLATPGDPHQKVTDRVAGTTVASATSPQASPPSTPPTT
jgi:uncharacterized RDD family membrane protein YckC